MKYLSMQNCVLGPPDLPAGKTRQVLLAKRQNMMSECSALRVCGTSMLRCLLTVLAERTQQFMIIRHRWTSFV